jgi:ABC-type bacteriocin/lantibiotic exporter with double-glycine peptidase domain
MVNYSGFVTNGIKAVNYQLIPARINEFVALLGIVILVIYGYYYSGDNLGQVRVLAALFAIAVFRLIPAANRLLQSLMHLKMNYYTIGKLRSIVNVRAEQKSEYISFEKEIALKNVGFSYNQGNESILENLDITIQKGDIIGISGPSGCGKTTLAKILLGFYEPTEGSILIDGKAVPESLQRLNLFSYMGQEPFILSGTVLENVALGIPPEKVDVERVKSCLERAAFHIAGVAEVNNYFVGENGARLSEGQQQRLVLSRELYRDAPVIILDEPTSSLDSTTEKEVIQTLKTLGESGKTILIIAHRERIFDICRSVYSLENHQLKKIK